MGGNPSKFTLQGSNTYLVGTGARRLLIDTGEGKTSWIQAVERTLKNESATVSDVIVTHWHTDHTGGIDQILALCPDAKVFKCEPSDGHLDIADGQVFPAEGATLTAVHTPGHTTDHVVLVLAEEDAMFTGDNVLGLGTAVFEDLAVYIASLHRMAPLFGGRAYPGHGPVVEKGPEKIREYIAHRQQREDQVVQTLRAAVRNSGSAMTKTTPTTTTGGGGGPSSSSSSSSSHDDGSMTAMELVKVIYSDVRDDLHPAAERGVLQILAKLLREDKVLPPEGNNRWRLKSRSPL